MSRLVTVSRVKVRRQEAAQVNTRRPPSALYRDEWASTEARYSLHRQQLTHNMVTRGNILLRCHLL